MILGVGIAWLYGDRFDFEEFSRMPERGSNNTSKHVYTPWKKISCFAHNRVSMIQRLYPIDPERFAESSPATAASLDCGSLAPRVI